jgi:hypothetical protein
MEQIKPYELSLGIEHLMTGAELVSETGRSFHFEYESPSVVRVTCREPFACYWRPQGQDSAPIKLNATLADHGLTLEFSESEVRFFARDMAEAMRAKFNS